MLAYHMETLRGGVFFYGDYGLRFHGEGLYGISSDNLLDGRFAIRGSIYYDLSEQLLLRIEAKRDFSYRKENTLEAAMSYHF